MAGGQYAPLPPPGESIPSVDFSPFLAEEGCVAGQPATAAQREAAARIGEVFRLHGFLYLDNFGITAEDMELAFGESKALFSLSDASKEGIKRYSPVTNTGFSWFASESLNTARPPDMKEAFNIRSREHFTNDYTGCPEGFGSMAEGLWDKLREAARRMFLACALALGIPDGEVAFFARTFAKMDLCTLRFLHCPPCDFDPEAVERDGGGGFRAIRIGEHTDFGMLTFLFHDAAASGEGLQVKAVEGGAIGGGAGGEEGSGWLEATGRGGSSAIVNTGALMARWTNDVWKATAHRVVVPHAAAAKQHRYSIAFFLDPDCEEIIKAHPACLAPGAAPKYELITSRDFVQMKINEMQVAREEVAPLGRGGEGNVV